MFCSTCDAAIEVSEKEDVHSAKDHLESNMHQKPNKNIHLQKFIETKATVSGTDESLNPNGIVFCQQISSMSAFCKICEVTIAKTPSSIRTHLKSTGHKQKSGDLPIPDTCEDILSKNADHLEKISQKKFKCRVCNTDFDGMKLGNVNRHIITSMHQGILAQSDEESMFVPFSNSEEDPFLLRREKFKRQKEVDKIPSELRNSINVKYDNGQKAYIFFCVNCNMNIIGGTKKVIEHVKITKHLNNTPNEKGQTQLSFEYDLAKMAMACKC